MRRLFRYLALGTIPTFFDVLVLNVLHGYLRVPLLVAANLGFVTAVIVGYFVHSRWSFGYDTTGRELTKLGAMFAVRLAGLLVTNVVMYVLALRLGIHYNLAKVVAMILSISWSYWMLSTRVFKK